MNWIQSSPHILFFVFCIILLSFGFYKGNETLDINVYDIYYIITWKHLMVLISLILGVMAFTYLILLKLDFKLVSWMTVSHVLLSILSLCMIFLLPKLIRESNPKDMEAYVTSLKFNNRIKVGILIAVFSLIGSQFLFFINVIYTFIKGRS